jgi:hypothetical protein
MWKSRYRMYDRKNEEKKERKEKYEKKKKYEYA